MVQEAVGGWLQERQVELGFDKLPELTDTDFASIRFDAKKKLVTNKAVEKHIKAWEAYRETLRTIRVLDPACGSGAFLNQVFDYLFQEGQRVNKELARLRGGQFEAFDLDKHILTNNIFGVDLNEESVEITKLSLWLKTANKSKELTTLDSNIKCGNSLVSDPEVAGNKAFNWHQEFPEVFAAGGFDVVVGNPPYTTNLPNTLKEYFKNKYYTAQYQPDLYVLFIELILSILNRNAFIGLITPNSWLKNLMMSNCRELLVNNLDIKHLIPNLKKVFPDASVDTLIIIGERQNEAKNEINIYDFDKEGLKFRHTVPQERIRGNQAFIFDIEINDKSRRIFQKVETNTKPVSDLLEVTRGINPYDIYTGQTREVIDSKAYHANYKKDETFVPEIRGKHVSRYSYYWDGEHYISYGNWLAGPREEKFFKGERIAFREILGDKLVCTYINEELKIDRSLYIAIPQSPSVEIKYILSLLASTLYAYYFKHKSNEFDILFPKIRVAEFKALPIKIISSLEQQPFVEKVNLMLQKNLELQQLNRKFLKLLRSELGITKPNQKLEKWYDLSWDNFTKELVKLKVKLSLPQKAEWLSHFEEQQKIASQIQNVLNQTDQEIDQMVYQLYELNPDEIAIVEGKV